MIALNGFNCWIKPCGERDFVLAQAIGRKFERAFDQLIEINRCAIGGALLGHRQKRKNDPAAAIRCIAQPPDRLFFRCSRQQGFEHGRADDHDRQRIVQFMRHPAQQRGQSAQFFVLVDLFALPGHFGFHCAAIG